MDFENFRNKNISSRHKYDSANASDIEYCQTLSPHHEGFGVSLNNPPSNFKKLIYKNRPDVALLKEQEVRCKLLCISFSNNH